MSKFSVCDYDCVGFDLDMTLARYKLINFNQLIYNYLSNYLVTEKKYQAEFLLKPIDLNFIIRGLIADNENGNLIRVSTDGKIIQATHGTKWLSKDEIIKFYPEGRWKLTDFWLKSPAENNDRNFKLLGDFLTLPTALVFARAIDSVDNQQGVRKKYRVLQDIGSGMRSVIFARKLCENDLGVFPELKKNLNNIYYKCSEDIINWMLELKKKGKKLFLMTGADVSHAFLTAENTLGKNWKELFDIIICYSEKPDFFKIEREFIKLEGFEETKSVPTEDLIQGGIYSYGNWKGLKQFLCKISQKQNPKILYIGDNIIQDVFAPNFYCQMDTIAICEELEAEKVFGFNKNEHPDKEFVNSALWGSFFSFKNTTDEVYLYYLIKKYAKICVPSMEYLAKFSIDYKFDIL